MTIRSLVAGSIVACVSAVSAASAAKQDNVSADRPWLKIWDTAAAVEHWDAVHIGNGRLAALVFGGVQKERIALNEDTLWSGGPQYHENPDAHKYLEAVRKLVNAGKYSEAEELAANMLGVPREQQSIQPLGNLWISFDHAGEASNYRRELDLATAIAKVEYEAGGARFSREVFASHPDQVIVVKLACDKPGGLSFEMNMDSLHAKSTRTATGRRLAVKGMVGSAGSKFIGPWHGEGVRFEARVQVDTQGGTVDAKDDKIVVENADEADLRISMATSFVNYRDISGDPAARVADHAAQLKGTTYEQLRDAHVRDYRELFDRVSIDLGGRDAAKRPTGVRLDALSQEDAAGDPDMIALLFQYGRYLLISSSRPGTQVPTIQGIWNVQRCPLWGARYTIDINIQMIYWPAEVCNLSECHDPLFDMLEDISETGARVAKAHYGADGWVVHINSDIWRAAAPCSDASHGIWATAGGWLCRHLWERYLFTRNQEDLKRFYPTMKGSAEFFLDYLVEDEKGHLLTNPSISPEQGHKRKRGSTTRRIGVNRRGVKICRGPTMDLQIVNDVFSSCIASSRLLGVDEEFRAELARARSRLSPMKIGSLGQLQEWYDDWDNPKMHHVHVSHLYGLYPADQIDRRKTPELAKAARQSLAHRTDSGASTGWHAVWRIALWARLGDGERAYEVLTHPRVTMPRGKALMYYIGGRANVILADSPMGMPAAIAEMLLQSHGGEIELLPALPKTWPDGSVSGLCARGNYEVSIGWRDGELSSASMLSKSGGTCRVRYGDVAIGLRTEEGQVYDLSTLLLQK